MKKPENNRVVVVGYEVATSLGYGLKKTWKRAVNGESGTEWITRVNVNDYPCQAVGEIPDLDFDQYSFLTKREQSNWFSKFIPLAMMLSHDALTHAGLEVTEEESYRTGIILGSALPGLDGYEQTLSLLNGGNYNKVSPFLLPNLCSNLSCGKSSILLNLKGPQYAMGGACATGNHCIADGAKIIQRGDADVMLAGGVEMPILEAIIYGFGNMNTLIKMKEQDRAFNAPGLSSRPYSKDRNGFVLSEGGAVLVLASLDFALERGLKIYGEILGVGMTGDAKHFTAPYDKSVVKCIELSLEDAQINKEDVDYINGHGTSTKTGDKTEVKSLTEVFGNSLKDIPISSNKSQIGHSLGATAAVEAVLTLNGMQEETILPTINYIEDPELSGLNFVPNKAINKDYSIALSNSFGFGGTNCCLVMKKYV